MRIHTKEDWKKLYASWKNPMCTVHTIPLIITKQYKKGSKAGYCPECAKMKYRTGKFHVNMVPQSWEECIDAYNELLDRWVENNFMAALSKCPKCGKPALTDRVIIPSLNIRKAESRWYCKDCGVLVDFRLKLQGNNHV